MERHQLLNPLSFLENTPSLVKSVVLCAEMCPSFKPIRYCEFIFKVLAYICLHLNYKFSDFRPGERVKLMIYILVWETSVMKIYNAKRRVGVVHVYNNGESILNQPSGEFNTTKLHEDLLKIWKKTLQIDYCHYWFLVTVSIVVAIAWKMWSLIKCNNNICNIFFMC